MIKHLSGWQRHTVMGGRFCFCHTKQNTVLSDDLPETVYCEYWCCSHLNHNKIIDSWSTMLSSWRACQQPPTVISAEDLLWATLKWTNNLNQAQ